MAKRRAPEPRQEQTLILDGDQIEHGIEKLRKRIDDLHSLARDRVNLRDQRVKNVEAAVQGAIGDIFGHDSRQYRTHKNFVLYARRFVDEDAADAQFVFESEIPQAVSLLNGLIRELEERRGDLGSSRSTVARTTFAGMAVHVRIDRAARQLYASGHYRNAILDAYLALEAYVQEKSARTEDGLSLVRTVFSKDRPILALNAGTSTTDKNEQEGVMHLFEGAVMAFRNPRAHGLDPDRPEDALEVILFLGMLARFVDGAEKR